LAINMAIQILLAVCQNNWIDDRPNYFFFFYPDPFHRPPCPEE